MLLRRIPHICIFLAIFAGLILSCSVEKNTAATRNFHNLTSHYNIYFNASESYKEGLERARQSYTDDYTSVLPLFYYEDESVQQSLGSQMKRAIDKCTKVITFHSITAKPKVKKGKQSEKDKAFYEKEEYNKWVDDCYLLIGKAYMHQGEYFKAIESFRHILKTFPELDTYHRAMTWLVRAYNTVGENGRAEELIVTLQGVEEFPEKYEEELFTTLADHYMRQEEWEKAAINLKKAVDTRPRKQKRIRYTYILAQLQSRAGKSEQSVSNYKKVVRMNPPYVMAFNAKVSMAEAFQAGASNSTEIKKILNKMLRDSKNEEFKDQIYYALGNIYMEEGDREKAIEYYHLSVSSSVQNNHQKGESCLTLAEIYYNEPVYTLSAAYYDTAVNLLESDYPGYSGLQTRSMSLNNLVRNIQTFELQDSIQELAGLPEAERIEAIDQIIARVIEEEEQARLREQQAMQDRQYGQAGMFDNQAAYGSSGQQGGKWYFYNLNAKSFGQPEFRMKWGERKLEDNWRRSNKQSTTDLIEEDLDQAAIEGDSTEVRIIDNKSREYYLRDIPLTDTAMEVSNLRLEEALYNMGMIYRDDLLDYERAIESLEELISRYPDGNYTMASYYYLHDLYNTVQQPEKANYYKELLSQNYPDSHMAMLLTNPDYIRELEEEQQQEERFYEEVYTAYRNEQFRQVIRKAEEGMKIYGENKDMSMRLSYLKALSVGAVRGKEEMKTELDTLLARYPGTEIALEAREIIEYMYVAFPVIKQAEQEKEAIAIYSYEPEADHKFVIALKNTENLNLVNFNLINYNLDNFAAYDLTIKLQRLGVDYNLLVVGEFGSYGGVSRYADRVKLDIEQIMGDIPADSYEVLLISVNNYNKLLEEKAVVPYLIFHRKNYGQQ